jgi:orotate phosphoribosyltransferase
MKYYQKAFLDLAVQQKILQFGEFVLKSGRKSPYFFNAGLFNSGATLRKVGIYYAMTIQESGLPYDMLFGPAYKGIPLACSTAIALSRYDIQAPFAFNRKEAKDHGEGGQIVGAPLVGKVLLLDDVITAGTAIREAIELVRQAGAEVTGIVVAFDRQEKGTGESSTIEALRKEGIPVLSIVTFNDLFGFIEKDPAFLSFKAALLDYREAYGA